MATAVEMPKLSDTMDEGVLVSWEFDEGDQVSDGDVIAQVETDKATMDLEAYDDGVLLKRMVDEGDAVPIGGLIAVLGEEGEDISEILAQHEGDAGPDASGEEVVEPDGEETDGREPATTETTGGAGPETTRAGEGEPSREAAAEARRQAESSANGRIKASPLARRMAGEEGIDLGRVEGSGPRGRIIKRDIEEVLEQRETRPTGPAREVASTMEEGYESTDISQMRKTIARRLSESKFSAPHFYETVDVDMGAAVEFRRQLNQVAEEHDRGKISYNDLITKACALALREHPDVNASYLPEEGEIRRYQHIHVAVAVAVEEGLLTPVVRHADQKGLAQIARETRELAEAARNRDLEPSDWEGSTFTTSNLGMFGVEEFTAIINPPNSAILAIGAIRDEPVVEEVDGEKTVVPGKRMKVTLSCDHRLVDGATGARFLHTVRKLLEQPAALSL